MIVIREQLNPKFYPQECWINVYNIGYVWYGAKYGSRDVADKMAGKLKENLIYRIHVKLK